MSDRRLVAVDIGNQRIKFGVMLPNEQSPTVPPPTIFDIPTRQGLTRRGSWDELDTRLPADNLYWCVASVHGAAQKMLSRWVATHRPGDTYRHLLNHELPLEVDVDHPDRVGTDRLLAAVAVNKLRTPGRPAVIVDAGTAITVDLVSSAGVFLGGVILPGFSLVARALAMEADQLPLLNRPLGDRPPTVIGKSTEAAIESGLFWGNIGAVRELVGRMSEVCESPPQLFFAGGDAGRLAAFIDPESSVVPELVFAGIAITHQRPGTDQSTPLA